MTKQIGSRVRDLSDGPLALINIELAIVGGIAFTAGTKDGLGNRYVTQTDAGGNWSALVAENDSLQPVGTLYRVTERIPLQYGGTRTYLIQVLTSLSSGFHDTMDLIIPEFSPVGVQNTFLTKAYADATYATIGSSGASGPPGPVGPPGGSSLPIVYTTEALLLADVSNIAGTIAFAQDTVRFFTYLGVPGWKYLMRGAADEEVMIYYVPGGNLDATTSATLTDWITLTSALTVPSWATKAKVHLIANGIAVITAASNGYDNRIVLDGQNGHTVRTSDPGSLSARVEFSIIDDTFTLTPGSNKVLKLQAGRSSGGGIYRADTFSDFDCRVSFWP